jgi:hypothetical protein
MNLENGAMESALMHPKLQLSKRKPWEAGQLRIENLHLEICDCREGVKAALSPIPHYSILLA